MNATKTLSFVPLDYRPFTCYTAVQIARIGGFRIDVPEPGRLGHYFIPGDSAAIGDWWARKAAGTAASVVAVPMLAYGGLIASRYGGGISFEQAQNGLQVIKRVKEQNPDHKIYAFDAITRLTTSPFRDYPGNYSGKIREWSILQDKMTQPGMEHLKAECEAVRKTIPPQLIDDYLKARERNFAINKRMIEWVRDGIIDFLILGQDDAEPYGMHRAERIELMGRIEELGLGSKIKLFPGADVIASLLIAKLALEGAPASPKVCVEYSRRNGEQWIAPYQDIAYSQVIRDYVSVLGGEMADNAEQADIVLMANTAGEQPIQSFAERIGAYLDDGRLVAVGDDAYAGTADPVLIELLRKRIRFSALSGYSGWNIGVSIAQALTRWTALQISGRKDIDWRLQSAQAHAELLLEALAHEEGYRNHVRNGAVAYARSIGDDPQRLMAHYKEIDRYAVEHALPYGNQWYQDHFQGERVALGAAGTQPLFGTITRLNGWQSGLPWNRTAEMEMFPELTVSVT
jgi:hypothetical protein